MYGLTKHETRARTHTRYQQKHGCHGATIHPRGTVCSLQQIAMRSIRVYLLEICMFSLHDAVTTSFSCDGEIRWLGTWATLYATLVVSSRMYTPTIQLLLESSPHSSDVSQYDECVVPDWFAEKWDIRWLGTWTTLYATLVISLMMYTDDSTITRKLVILYLCVLVWPMCRARLVCWQLKCI